MSSLYLITFGKSPIASEDVNQLVRALNGTDNTAIAITGVNDPAVYALSARNQAAGGKALAVYNVDGTLAIDVSGGVPKLRQPGITDFINAQHTHTSAAQGGLIAQAGWRDPVFLSLL